MCLFPDVPDMAPVAPYNSAVPLEAKTELEAAKPSPVFGSDAGNQTKNKAKSKAAKKKGTSNFQVDLQAPTASAKSLQVA